MPQKKGEKSSEEGGFWRGDLKHRENERLTRGLNRPCAGFRHHLIKGQGGKSGEGRNFEEKKVELSE